MMLPLLFPFQNIFILVQNKRTKKFMKMYYEAVTQREEQKNMFMRPLFFISSYGYPVFAYLGYSKYVGPK